MNDDDLDTTILTQICDTLEQHNKILGANQKHLVRLSGEVAELKGIVKELMAANSLDSSDAKFLISLSDRLKAISNALNTEP